MPRAMYEYTKKVLLKVSFDNELFEKELIKAEERLLPHELKELFLWLSDFTLHHPKLRPSFTLIKDKKRKI
ncbi:MAG: hypothetical protein QGH06_08030 [Lutibacter sp.]|nr:hypothetical protein [Lutibacter sp.]